MEEDTTENTKSHKDDKVIRRKVPGRAARRRRKKLRDIQRAEKELLEGTSSSSTKASSLVPQDRSMVRPSVQVLKDKYGWNSEDEQTLVAQLGYIPGNAIRIACRMDHVLRLLQQLPCTDANDPVVLQLYPLVLREEYKGGKVGDRKFKARKRLCETSKEPQDDDKDLGPRQLLEPFPTVFWLTHPLLRIMISRLELDGFGGIVEKRLAAKPEYLETMKQAHLAYGRERAATLTAEDWNLVKTRKWESAFDISSRGVAGIRDFGSVKCLHAHAAHYLSGNLDNLVGHWVLEELRSRLVKA